MSDEKWTEQGMVPGISYRGELVEIGPEPYRAMRGKETVAYATPKYAGLIAAAPAMRDALNIIASGNTDPDRMVEIAEAALSAEHVRCIVCGQWKEREQMHAGPIALQCKTH